MNDETKPETTDAASSVTDALPSQPTDADVDGYYGDDDMDDEELDLSFLDEADDEADEAKADAAAAKKTEAEKPQP
jgi:hypothetical protein